MKLSDDSLLAAAYFFCTSGFRSHRTGWSLSSTARRVVPVTVAREDYCPCCGCSAAGTFTRPKSAEEADGTGLGREGRGGEERREREMRRGKWDQEGQKTWNKQVKTNQWDGNSPFLYMPENIYNTIYYQTSEMSSWKPPVGTGDCISYTLPSTSEVALIVGTTWNLGVKPRVGSFSIYNAPAHFTAKMPLCSSQRIYGLYF